MRNIIKNIFTNYIFCAVVGGVLQYLIPESSRKILRVIIVGIILVTTFSPLAGAELEIKTDISDDSGNIEYEALLHTANLTEKKLRQEMKTILINHNVEEYEIYITTSVDKSENTVYLESVVIELGAEYSHLTEKVKNSIPQEYQEILQLGVKND